MGQRTTSTLRTLLIIFNIVFWFSGLGVLGLGIWLFLAMGDLRAAIIQTDFEVPTYLMIGSGASVVVVGIIGCMAIFGANRCLLAFYSTCVFLLCVVDITACIKTFFIYNDMPSLVIYRLNVTVKYKYLVEDDVTSATDHLQQKFKCCGINSYSDWSDPNFNIRAPSLIARGYHPYPTSCCLDTDNCNLKITNSSVSPDIFLKGCIDPVVSQLNLLLPLVGWSTMGLSALLIIGGTMICCYRLAVK